jgi:transketolase C-terminal domain/subunit
MVKDLGNMNSSCTPDYIYTLNITYEVDDESGSLRVYLRFGRSVCCAMSKEGRFEIGHSASEAKGKRSNESISARGLIAMVLLEDLWRKGVITGVRRRERMEHTFSVGWRLFSR